MATATGRLHVLSFGLAFGTVWGLSVLLIGLFAAFFGVGTPFVIMLGSLYHGFEASIAGSIVGLFWGFFDAFIGGVVFAYLYNWFSKHCS